MTGVVINDYVINKRITLFFIPEDYALVDHNWQSTDPVLLNLQHIALFSGRTRWCDLEITHFRLLVAKNLQNAAMLATDDRMDDDNPIVSSLNYLICCLIRCIEIAGVCSLESMRINRLGDIEITIEYTASVIETDVISALPPKTPFSIIIDNTEQDDGPSND